MRNFLSLLLIVLPVCLFAQSAETYFHNSAKLYIGDKKEQAISMLDEGIRKYPADTTLQALRQRITMEQKQPPPKPKPDQQKQEQQKQEQQKQAQQGEGEKKQGEQQQPKQAQLSKEQAERLLKSLTQEEQRVQQQLVFKKLPPAQKKTTDKDW